MQLPYATTFLSTIEISLLADDMIIFIENQKEPTGNFIRNNRVEQGGWT